MWAEDNLLLMDRLLTAGYGGSVDLVYLDPPFLTGDRFGMAGAEGGVVGSYSDRWDSVAAYLQFLRERLTRLQRLLAPHGALFLHCDWRASAHLRLMLDEIFGAANFRNEIIWRRGDNRGRKSCARHLGRTTDSILYFVKDADHRALRFHPPVQLRRHQLGARGRLPAGFYRDADGRYFKTAPRGDYTDASIQRLRQENRVYETRNGLLRIKYFLECRDGAILEPIPVDTLWTDLPDAMHLAADERFGYPTQKPLSLLSRIVACASDPGDLVFDPFCGSGTTVVAAATAPGGRRFWGCDLSPAAVNLATARLCLSGAGGGKHEDGEKCGAGGTPAPVFARLGADPVSVISAAALAAACGVNLRLATPRAQTLTVRVAPRVQSTPADGAVPPSAHHGRGRRSARGVRLNRSASAEAAEAASAAGATDPHSRETPPEIDRPLCLELHSARGGASGPGGTGGTGGGGDANTTGTEPAPLRVGIRQRERPRRAAAKPPKNPPPDGPAAALPLQIPLAGPRGSGYYCDLIDGLGRKFRVALQP